jgi:hypothetical protein
MAKELPYFRFTVQEWQNGTISLERYELQGFFIAVCGYYWIQNCDITLAILKKKFSNAIPMLNELIELGVLKHENKHDKIKIDFLLTQHILLSEKRKLRQEAGSKGGNAKAMLKQNYSYKDKDKDKDNTLFFEFVEDVWKIPFMQWVEYRNKGKKPFTMQMAVEQSYKELKELSENKPYNANKIVQYCISNQYVTLCKPDKNQPTQTSKLQYNI